MASLSSSSASRLPSLPFPSPIVPSSTATRRVPVPKSSTAVSPVPPAHPGNYLSLSLSLSSLSDRKSMRFRVIESASKGNRPCSSRSEIANPRLLQSILTSNPFLLRIHTMWTVLAITLTNPLIDISQMHSLETPRWIAFRSIVKRCLKI